jgi:hypothetical protein
MKLDRKELQLIRIACRYVVLNHPVMLEVISDTTNEPTGESFKLTDNVLPYFGDIIAKCTKELFLTGRKR